MSSPGAVDGGVSAPSITTSSITTVATSGSHMLKINGYSAAKRVMSPGSHAKSSEFEAAGHTWCILFFPNGNESKVADHISLHLRLARNVDKNVAVNARFRFSLVPHHCSGDGGGDGAWGKKTKPKARPQVVPYHRESLTAAFQHTYSHGIPCFVRREVLEKSEYHEIT